MTRRVAGIDLLRGVAIGLVMLRHAWPAVFPGAGAVGVVMFFALSGYLITGLLLEELQRTGRVGLRAFYVRRARRLVPGLLFLVLGVVTVTLLFDPLHDRGRLVATVAIALTWTGDLPFGHASDATFHLWTLAVEEQFYLLWPAVLAVAFTRRRVPTALVVVGGLCLLACVATVLWLRESPDLAYPLPTSWAVCFVVGAAVRVRGTTRAVPPGVAVAALLGLGTLGVIPWRGHALTYLLGGPVIAALTGVLLLHWRTRTAVDAAPLRALVWLGTVSYGAYLWNYPLTVWLRPHLDHAGVVAALLTLPMAALSWYVVERPWRTRRASTVAVPA